jgi:hypothetical protein
MAKLYLLRRGTGDASVASIFEVPAARVEQVYGQARVTSSPRLPVIDGGPASALDDPAAAVVELLEGEPAFTRFRSPGFNMLVGVHWRDAHRELTDDK